MGLLKKLFGDGESNNKKPDNTTLINFLHVFENNENPDTYASMQDELFNGNAFLLLPSVNGSGTKEPWKKVPLEKDMELTFVNDIDGIITLCIFTHEEALTTWGLIPD